VKRLTVLVIPAILLAGMILFGLSDTAISVADTSTSNSEVRGGMSKAGNSSASATITITMYTGDDE